MTKFTKLSLAAIANVLLIFLIVGCVSQTQSLISSTGGTTRVDSPELAVPPLPELKDVTVDSKTTALLILDMQKQTCSLDRRPSCVASIPKVNSLLKQARANKMLVVYSLTRGAQVADIVSELLPLGGEPVVISGPDKFIGTELESILKKEKIGQVIVTGTAAHGAALHTAAGAAFRGFNAIVPIDGISAEPFSEYYTVWHLANAPALRDQVTISRSDKIRVAE